MDIHFIELLVHGHELGAHVLLDRHPGGRVAAAVPDDWITRLEKVLRPGTGSHTVRATSETAEVPAGTTDSTDNDDVDGNSLEKKSVTVRDEC